MNLVNPQLHDLTATPVIGVSAVRLTWGMVEATPIAFGEEGFGVEPFGSASIGGWNGNFVIVKRRHGWPDGPGDPKAVVLYDGALAVEAAEYQFVDDGATYDGTVPAITQEPIGFSEDWVLCGKGLQAGVDYYYAIYTGTFQDNVSESVISAYAYGAWGHGDFLLDAMPSIYQQLDDGSLAQYLALLGGMLDSYKTDVERLGLSRAVNDTPLDVLDHLSNMIGWFDFQWEDSDLRRDDVLEAANTLEKVGSLDKVIAVFDRWFGEGVLECREGWTNTLHAGGDNHWEFRAAVVGADIFIDGLPEILELFVGDTVVVKEGPGYPAAFEITGGGVGYITVTPAPVGLDPDDTMLQILRGAPNVNGTNAPNRNKAEYQTSYYMPWAWADHAASGRALNGVVFKLTGTDSSMHVRLLALHKLLGLMLPHFVRYEVVLEVTSVDETVYPPFDIDLDALSGTITILDVVEEDILVGVSEFLAGYILTAEADDPDDVLVGVSEISVPIMVFAGESEDDILVGVSESKSYSTSTEELPE